MSWVCKKVYLWFKNIGLLRRSLKLFIDFPFAPRKQAYTYSCWMKKKANKYFFWRGKNKMIETIMYNIFACATNNGPMEEKTI